jgi:hypothetical protein
MRRTSTTNPLISQPMLLETGEKIFSNWHWGMKTCMKILITKLLE